MGDENTKEIVELIDSLRRLPAETEWVEFKSNYQDAQKIGEYISALSNSACLHQKTEAYLIFGIDNDTHDIVGTTYSYRTEKGKGHEPLESWLVHSLKPTIDFRVLEFDHSKGKKMVVFIIPPASFGPVKFLNIPYVRIGETTKPLDGFTEKEAIIWSRRTPFEMKIARENVSEADILDLLNYDQYFRLTKEARPKTKMA